MPPSSDSFLLRLRSADPDRFFCTLFAPADKREALALLYLFNHELARAHEVASEQLLAMIRLQWWREVVEGASRKHEVATPLSAALEAGVFAREDLLALIEAREAGAELEDASSFHAYARGTGGRLARIAGKLLGADFAGGGRSRHRLRHFRYSARDLPAPAGRHVGRRTHRPCQGPACRQAAAHRPGRGAARRLRPARSGPPLRPARPCRPHVRSSRRAYWAGVNAPPVNASATCHNRAPACASSA